MAKPAGQPRKHIRVIRQENGTLERSENGNGVEIHGLHFHAANRSYYRLVPDPGNPKTGRRPKLTKTGNVKNVPHFYGRDLAEALAQHCAETKTPQPFRSVATLRDMADVDKSDDLQTELEKVLSDGFDSDFILTDDQRRQLLRYAYKLAGGTDQPPAKERLSNVWQEWESAAKSRGVKGDQIQDVKRCFDRLVRLLGDKPINHLTEDDLATWRDHIATEAKTRSPRWIATHHKSLKQVLTNVQKIKTAWEFPANLWLWLDAWTITARAKVSADPSHKQPMTPDEFQSLISHCETMTNRRDGIQLKAVLLLVANCGLDNIDACRLTPDHLQLDAKMPYLDFSRGKISWQGEDAVERLIPLLPQTVQALQEWIAYEPATTSTIFRSAGRGMSPQQEFDSKSLAKKIEQLRGKTGVVSSLKHLRNVPGTLAKAASLPTEMADYVLGHKTRGILDRYTGDMLIAYSLPLIQRIEADYFPKKKSGKK